MKRTLRSFLVLLTFLFVQNYIVAQSPVFQCASDAVMQTHEELLLRQNELEEELLKKQSSEKQFAPPYTLPVVVHVVHENGNENISDNQVFNAIEYLNQAYAHQGYYADQGDGFDTQVQFCLAKRDPDGNATNGITRTVSSLTDMFIETQDQALKDVVRWPTTDYINIWVVKEISRVSAGSGVVGYAYLASAHGDTFDGIVCEASYFGSSEKNNAVLIHEMGHYLNLYHTFQGGCGNDDCLSGGDRVCDTPPDQSTFSSCGFNSCNTDTDDGSANNPLTADVADMTENYMDYSPLECYHAFSEGQANRMYAAIDGPRKSLLESSGCLDPCLDPITIGFTSLVTEVLAGETIDFTNVTAGATDYEWKADGVVFSNNTNASYTFNDVGVVEIELVANNNDPNCQEVFSIFIKVNCPIIPGFDVSATELNVGETFTATNTTQNADSYEWWINGVLVSSETDLNYIFNYEGFYSVRLEASGNLCTKVTTESIRVTFEGDCNGFLTDNSINYPAGFLRMDGVAENGDFFVSSRESSGPKGLSKYAVNGDLLWKKNYDNLSEFGDMQSTDDGGCVFRNSHSSDMRVGKMEADGTLDWVKAIVGSGGTATYISGHYSSRSSIIELSDGLIAFTENPTAEADRLRAVRFDSNGNVVWNKIYDLNGLRMKPGFGCLSSDGNSIWIVGLRIVSNPQDRGYVVFKIGIDGELEMMKSYVDAGGVISSHSLRDIAPTPNNGFVVVSAIRLGNQNDEILHVVNGDAAGEIVWSKRFYTGLPQNITGAWPGWISVAANGDFWIGNIVNNLYGFNWFSLDGEGEPKFKRKLFDSDGEELKLYFLKNLPNGNSLISGQRLSNSHLKFMTEMNGQDGLLSNCAYFEEENLEVEPGVLSTNSHDFSLLSDTLVIEDLQLDEVPFTDNLISGSFCSDPIPCPENCDNGIDDDEDGYVDCFDTDCDCYEEGCFAQNPTNDSITAQLAWRTDENLVSALSLPIVANLDPQNGPIPEIIVSERSVFPGTGEVKDLLIYQGDGSNATQPVTLPYLFDHFGHDNTPAVGDINGDGVIELVLNTRYDEETRIMVFTDYDPTQNPSMRLMAETIKATAFTNDKPTLADLDQDGIAEIITRSEIYRFDFTDPLNPTLNLVLTGPGYGGVNGIPTAQPAIADILRPSDCNGDPDCDGLELIAGIHIYSIDLDPLDGDGIEIKIQRDLNAMEGLTLGDGFTYTADVNLDGILDIVVAELIKSEEVGVYVWDKDGLMFHHRQANPFWRILGVTINNVFDDRTQGYAQDFPEIVFSTRHEMVAMNLNRATTFPTDPFWWEMAHPDPTDAVPATFDLNGDGLAEIIYRNTDEFRVMYGGHAPYPQGVDNERNYYKTDCFNVTRNQYPVIADVDDDGEAEIVVTGSVTDLGNSEYQRNLWVFQSDDFPWMPARPFWNQYGYFGLNINDDLSLPKQQQLHHLEFPGIGSGERPYNIATAQMPILNNAVGPSLIVADVTVEVDSSQCAADSTFLWLTVCNHGAAALPANLPISFYQNNPTVGSAVLMHTALTDSEVGVDGCMEVLLKIPAIYNAPIFILVNDNGTLPTPFDLENDFPNTNVLECDYENNLTQFELNHLSPDLDLGPDRAICNSSVFTFDAGDDFVKYRWQDGSVESIFTAYEPGLYWVDVWDVCGFKQTDSVRIELDQVAGIDLGDDMDICEGGSVDLSVSGFPNVHWWPADGLSCTDCPMTTASPSGPKTYYATASNGACFSTDSIKVNIAPAPSVVLEANNGGCIGNASITATSIDGQVLTFLWETDETGATIIPSQSGTYTVTATNSAGCEFIDSAFVSITGGSDFTAITSANICHNDSTASVQLDLSDVNQPYEIIWSNGSTDETLTNLPAGDYEVTVTDVDGCTGVQLFSFTNPPALLIDPNAIDISCNNDAGFITLSAEGGTFPLSVLWSNGETTDSINVTAPATYAATVTDANGCSISSEFDVLQDEALLISLNLTSLNCYGDMNGEASVETLNGEVPFVYSWGNGHADSLLTGLGTEPHAVTVTDARGCMESVAFNLLQPDSLELSASSIPEGCSGEMSGSVSVAVEGGEPDYSYLWNTGDNTPSVNDLSAGEYTVTITDELGCIDSIAVEVGTTTPLEITAMAEQDSICPDATTSLSAMTTGGTAPYSYLWNGQQADSTWVDVPAGSYELLVTDANGCTSIEMLMIGEFSAFVAFDVDIQPATGMDNADGALQVSNPIGGNAPYTYEWSTGDTTMLIDSLLPGIYMLSVTDADGCITETELEVPIMVSTNELDDAFFNISLFPNPIDEMGMGTLSVHSSVAQTIDLKILDVTGRILQKENWRHVGGTQLFSIPAPDVAGIYFVQVNERYLKWVVSGRKFVFTNW